MVYKCGTVNRQLYCVSVLRKVFRIYLKINKCGFVQSWIFPLSSQGCLRVHGSLPIHMCFVYLSQGFDRIPVSLLWEHGVSGHYEPFGPCKVRVWYMLSQITGLRISRQSQATEHFHLGGLRASSRLFEDHVGSLPSLSGGLQLALEQLTPKYKAAGTRSRISNFEVIVPSPGQGRIAAPSGGVEVSLVHR